MNIYAYGAKLGQACYKELTGHNHKTYCPTRWWSKFDCLEEIAVDWSIVIPQVLVNIVRKSSTPNSSAAALHTLVTANRRSKADMIRLELAAVIDGGSIFRNGTYFL